MDFTELPARNFVGLYDSRLLVQLKGSAGYGPGLPDI
jgi:hypothetical protein